jgi:hypothetical protein
MFAMTLSFVNLPVSIAAEYTKKAYPYIGAMPNPVGVGQEVLLHVGITDQVDYGFHGPNDGWEGLTVTVTRPDGTSETLGPFTTDLTGGTGAVYIPTMVGNYTLQTNFPETFVPIAMRTIPNANTTMLAATSPPLTLVVHQEPVPIYPTLPLPTEYWSRPIDAQIREWATIGGGPWLPIGINDNAPVVSSPGPQSAHILWAKPLIGGVGSGLGGGLVGELIPGPQGYECGDGYVGFYSNSVVIGGVLYMNRFKSAGGTNVEQEVVAADLRTGEELWTRNWNNTRLAFGQVMYWDSFNDHGARAYLWTTSGTTWNAYDPATGRWEYSMTNVPSGTSIIGPKGEFVRYTLNTANGWMTMWNSTRAANPQNSSGPNDGSWIDYTGRYGTTFSASGGNEWNVTAPKGLPGSTRATLFDDRIIGSTLGAIAPWTAQTVTVWGVSLAPGQEGTLLFNTTWSVPNEWLDGNLILEWMAFSSEDKVGVICAKETGQNYGVSLETGKIIWGPSEPQYYLDALDNSKSGSRVIYNGKLYCASVSGIVYCYDVKTGDRLWTYEITDPLNEILWANTWWARPLFIADGKLYLGHFEHSVIDPKPRGAPFTCLDAETGEVIWRIDGAFRQTMWGGRPVMGDGIIATYDTYNQLVYGIGKGPSSMTVDAPMTAVTAGASVVLRGTITDISAGTEDDAIRLRFPNGVPAVSDESMSDWMLYIYKQFPHPTNATGVPVTLDVIDANGNYRNIGATISDADGFYSFEWQPDITGKFTVTATFEGSNSYWPSHAQTAFVVDEAATTPAPTTAPQSNLATTADLMMYLAIGVVAIIIAIAIVGMLLFRKRP